MQNLLRQSCSGTHLHRPCGHSTLPCRRRRRSSFATCSSLHGVDDITFGWESFAMVAVVAASLPYLWGIVDPFLKPMRCKVCMGATTVLCPTCKARGKIGGLFTERPLQCCGTCSGAGRVACGRCRGAGMANSWLWRTDMLRPSDTPGLKGSFDDRIEEALQGSDGWDGYPEIGENSGGNRKRQTFRKKVREQQRL